MHSFEQRIRIKVGFLFLVIVLYITGIFVFSHNLKKTMNAQKKELTNAYKISAYTKQLIISIQQAQDIFNTQLTSPQKKLQYHYDSISSEISQQISAIRDLSPQKGQELLWGNLDSLLQEKNIVVNRLIRQLRSTNPIAELNRKIEKPDSSIHDQTVVTIHRDTMWVVKKKSGFWSRLKNLVSPQHMRDTTVRMAREEKKAQFTSRVDTSAYSDLKKITQAASKSYSYKIQGIEKQVRELILAEQGISWRISELINEVYEESIRQTRRGVYKSEELTQKTFLFAVGTGVVSLIIILLTILFIVNDLHEGQKARLALVKEKQRTEELMNSRHKLLLAVSHDIKTPLSSIMGYLEMWDQEKMSEDKKRQLGSVQNSGQHILSMLTNLLEFSRLEQNSGQIKLSSFDVVKLTQETIRMFLPLMEGKKIDLKFENCLTESFFVETDYTAVKQILSNILSNAVKYTSKGFIRIKLEHLAQLIFTVTDTGVGMDAKTRKEIFIPFSSVKNPLNLQGSGLGMYVTKGLIDSLGGDIDIHSKKNEGTRITIKLPIKTVEKTSSVCNESCSPQQKTYKSILLFEDDLSLGNMIREYLVQNGYKVKLCTDARDVNGYLNHLSSFDIVFTDMHMTDITGIDILRKINKSTSHIPVWLMTAYDEYSIDRAIKEGFSGFVEKPIQMAKLLEVLSGKKKEVARIGLSKLGERFPELVSMFGEDKKSIVDILKEFVQSSRKDMDALSQCIKEDNFVRAQEVCHKVHPFLNQIGFRELCVTLQKIDFFSGKGQVVFPFWKEELAEAIRQIGVFSDEIERDYLTE